MARSALELDFFGMKKDQQAATAPPKLFERRRSFRDIQSMISKINPEVLKTVIASGSVEKSINPIAPETNNNTKDAQKSFPPLPLYAPTLSSVTENNDPENAPLTIFYNGTVAVFDVTPNKAEKILSLAERGNLQLLETSYGDLPITRRKSLERFLEKRKERMTRASPCGFPLGYESSSNKAGNKN